MKTRTTKSWVKALGLLGLVLTSQALVHAQDDLLFETDNVLESEQLDIDGQYNQRPQKSAADRMADMRRKLEKKNEDMVHKKIEDVRIREEAKLAKQLHSAFTNGFNGVNQDQVKTQQAAVEKVEAPAPKPERLGKDNKVIPTFGVTNVKGADIDLETKVSMGLAFETMVSRNFSAGFGLSYATMDISDYSNTQFNNPNYYGGYNNYNTYNQNYTQGRSMKYNRLQMEVSGKYFFTVENKIRPFLAAGVSYNRSKLEYENNENYSFGGYDYGDEGYSSSYIGATAMFGSEVVFTDNFGAQLDFRYNRGLTGGFDSDSNVNTAQSPDQRRLEAIGTSIEDADFFSINAGIVFMF